MPKAGRSHDIVLRNTDGSSNEVGINVFRESPNLLGGYVSEIIPLHPDQSKSQPATQQNVYEDIDPNLDLIHEQTSWHRGAGQAAVKRVGIDDFRYATGDGCLTIFQGSLVSGYYEDTVDILMRNPRFKDQETGASLGWTALNVTLSTDETNQRSGLQALGVTVGSNNGTITQRYGGDATVFQGESITLRFYIKRLTGSGTVRANLIDSVGTTNGSTSSATSFAQIEVTRAIDAGATTLDFQLEFSNAGDTWVIDDGSVLPPGGSVDFNDDGVTLSDEFYIGCGRMVVTWNESDDAFYAVYVDAAFDVECIAEFDVGSSTPTLFIGFAVNQAYKVSTDGTTWAAPGTVNSDTRDFASFFAIVRDANGDFSLAKSTGVEVRISGGDISADTTNWGAGIPVGSSDKPINNLIVSNDLLYPGKTDGLYKYDRATGKFIDLEPEGGQFDHVNNYKAGIGRGGKIYAGTGARSFFAVTDQGGRVDWDDLSHLVKNETWEGFSGDVEAITQDKSQVWLALNSQLSTGFPYAFPINFDENDNILDNTRVVVLRPDVDQVTGAQLSTNLVPHTMTTVTATNIQRIARFVQAANVDSVFIFGRFTNSDSSSDEARVFRLRIPVDNENPARALAAQRLVRKISIFSNGWIDWFHPDTPKTLTKITLNTKNLATGRTILVSIKVDDATPEDDEGWTDIGSVTTSPIGTVTASLTSPVEFRRIRIRLKLITNDITELIEVFSYTIHAVFNPTEHRKWTIESKFSDKRNSRRGRRVRRRSTLSKADLTNLETLRKEAFCIFEDELGDTHRVNIRQLRQQTVESDDVGGGGTALKTRIVRLELNEVRTAE